MNDAGVGDDDVRYAEVGQDTCGRVLDLPGVRDVTWDRDGAPARRHHVSRGVREGLDGAPEEGEITATTGQLHRDGATDATSRAGDHRDQRPHPSAMFALCTACVRAAASFDAARTARVSTREPTARSPRATMHI